jgi:hypothetical protein
MLPSSLRSGEGEGRPASEENDVQSVRGYRSANLHHRLAAAAGLVHRGAGTEELPRSHGQFALPRAVRGCGLVLSTGAGNSRPRHLDRRRRALRRGGRRHELAGLSADPHGRFCRIAAADGLQDRRCRLSARAYPARLPRSARVSQDRGACRARQAAVHGDVEDGAAHDHEADQVRDHPARTDRGFRRGRLLQRSGRAHVGDQQCTQRGTP